MSNRNSKADIPVLQLTGLSFAAFLAIMTETIPTGVLVDMAESFETTTGKVGQFLTAYAAGSVVAAIPVMTATRKMQRKNLLVIAILGLGIFNALTALTSHLWIAFLSRFVSGMAGGVIWGLVANYARSLVSSENQGRALAIIGFGQPFALAFGVPLGALGGQHFGWRMMLGMLTVTSIVLVFWISYALPHRPGLVGGAPGVKVLKRSILMPGVIGVLAALFGWTVAHNMVYTYIQPLTGAAEIALGVDIVLLFFGISAGISILLTAFAVDKRLFLTGLILGALMLIGFLLLSVPAASNHLFIFGIIVWGFGFGGAPTVLQTALARNAGDLADIAQSFFVTIFNFGVGVGGVLGGAVLSLWGASALSIAAGVMCVLVIGLLAFRNRDFGRQL
ncbi:MFS transporter [Corynebacterium sp. p3-SID1194]|uniref:MFS transporter n=1 Tax=Corynebacterium sp. p3-SID1194 TaxID=2916105 RepID=UPI0021A67026|nr:MFS transporter [Corynebacterium sp. p3-SID1194]